MQQVAEGEGGGVQEAERERALGVVVVVVEKRMAAQVPVFTKAEHRRVLKTRGRIRFPQSSNALEKGRSEERVGEEKEEEEKEE